jgi:hypothetical protein
MYANITVSQVPSILEKVGVGRIEPLYLKHIASGPNPVLSNGVVYDTVDNDNVPQKPELLSIVSEDYMLLQNREILNRIVGEFEGSEKIVIKEHSGTMTTAVFAVEEFHKGFSAGLILQNSMDGRVKYTIQPSIMKLVCKNGMMMVHAVSQAKIMHLEKNRIKLPELMGTFRTQLEDFIQIYERSSIKKVSQEKLAS